MVDEAFLSLVVLSATNATAIVSGVLLSIFWLKEVFIWQFDVCAITLITMGSLAMILQADKQPDNFTYE
jgi:hypothetical protein